MANVKADGGSGGSITCSIIMTGVAVPIFRN